MNAKKMGYWKILAFLLVIFLIVGGVWFTRKVVKPVVTAPGDHLTEAINILEAVPEIQTIKEAIIKAGRKPFFTLEEESGESVKLSLRESFPEDQHTTRIDTFNVNLISKVVTVEDTAADKEISLEEWKKTVKGRFE